MQATAPICEHTTVIRVGCVVAYTRTTLYECRKCSKLIKLIIFFQINLKNCNFFFLIFDVFFLILCRFICE